MLSRFSRVQSFATPWNIAHQAPLSMGFSGHEYWSGVPFPSPLDRKNTTEILGVVLSRTGTVPSHQPGFKCQLPLFNLAEV